MTQSYEAFASEPEYLAVNKDFIDSIAIAGVRRVLDLACGTGTLTQLLADALRTASQRVDATIVGLDISRESLDIARLQWSTSAREFGPEVTFVQASACEVPLRSEAFDLVLCGNAIQLFEDKRAVVRAVHDVLRRHGTFAFNTSFYAGSFVAGTERFYLNWVQEAYRYVTERAENSEGRGQRAPRRRKEPGKQAFSQPWLSTHEYEQLLNQSGFEIQSTTERVVMLTEHSFQSIGSYTGLASVLLSGYPPDLASEALARSAGPALASAGVDAIPRNWIEFIARRA